MKEVVFPEEKDDVAKGGGQVALQVEQGLHMRVLVEDSSDDKIEGDDDDGSEAKLSVNTRSSSRTEQLKWQEAMNTGMIFFGENVVGVGGQTCREGVKIEVLCVQNVHYLERANK